MAFIANFICKECQREVHQVFSDGLCFLCRPKLSSQARQVVRDIHEPMKESRLVLIKALAYCVESLAAQSLMESSGAINAAMKTDEKIWDYLDVRTVRILDDGLGIKKPYKKESDHV